MSCPTCDHTMQSLGETDTGRRWWCPRCGTLKTNGRFEGIDTPKLVGRCRVFETKCLLEGEATAEAISLWLRLGLSDSINPPACRPPV